VTADHRREDFAVALHNSSQSVFISGGDVNGSRSDTVLRFSLLTLQFCSIASMKHRRYKHSSLVHSDVLYVFGGSDPNWETMNSIEIIDLADPEASWAILLIECFTKRYNACVASLDPTQLIICGGFQEGSYLSDVILLDTRTNEARNALEAPFAFRNSWHN